MTKKFFLITILLFLLTACAPSQPQAGSSSPFIDALKKTQDIRETAEERKAAAEQVLREGPAATSAPDTVVP